MLLVTHDRLLLEDIRCTHVVEISEKNIVPYRCRSIFEWEAERALRVKQLKKEMDKLGHQIQLDKDFVAKWGAKTSHASLAQARKKKIARAEIEYRKLDAATRGLPSASVVLGKGSA